MDEIFLQKPTRVYRAVDGKLFTNKAQCRTYENKSRPTRKQRASIALAKLLEMSLDNLPNNSKIATLYGTKDIKAFWWALFFLLPYDAELFRLSPRDLFKHILENKPKFQAYVLTDQ